MDIQKQVDEIEKIIMQEIAEISKRIADIGTRTNKIFDAEKEYHCRLQKIEEDLAAAKGKRNAFFESGQTAALNQAMDQIRDLIEASAAEKANPADMSELPAIRQEVLTLQETLPALRACEKNIEKLPLKIENGRHDLYMDIQVILRKIDERINPFRPNPPRGSNKVG